MHLGLHDCFDVVLGSSAGSIIGTYLLGSEDPAQHRESTYQVLSLLALLVQKVQVLTLRTGQFFCNYLTTSREKLNGSSWLDMGGSPAYLSSVFVLWYRLYQ
jgi:hypothetical protein